MEFKIKMGWPNLSLLQDQIHKSGQDKDNTTNSETKKRSCYERLIMHVGSYRNFRHDSV